MIQILSTKTLSGNQKQALTKANFNVIEVDFIQTKNHAFELNEMNENLVFTRQNGVRSVL